MGVIYFIIIVFYFLLIIYSAIMKDQRTIEQNIKAQKRLVAKDGEMEARIEKRILKNEAYDEVSRRCRKLADNGEVTYFSVEDIDRIVYELKKEN